MSRIRGGGDEGHWLQTTLYPDSTFKSEIDSLVSSGTKVVGKLIQLATSDGRYCTSPAASADPDGDIITYENDATYGYKLTCRIWGYNSVDSNRHSCSKIINMPFSATPALGYAVKVTGGTYRYIRGSATDGVGFVLAVDNTNARCDVLI